MASETILKRETTPIDIGGSVYISIPREWREATGLKIGENAKMLLQKGSKGFFIAIHA